MCGVTIKKKKRRVIRKVTITVISVERDAIG